MIMFAARKDFLPEIEMLPVRFRIHDVHRNLRSGFLTPPQEVESRRRNAPLLRIERIRDSGDTEDIIGLGRLKAGLRFDPPKHGLQFPMIRTNGLDKTQAPERIVDPDRFTHDKAVPRLLSGPLASSRAGRFRQLRKMQSPFFNRDGAGGRGGRQNRRSLREADHEFKEKPIIQWINLFITNAE